MKNIYEIDTQKFYLKKYYSSFAIADFFPNYLKYLLNFLRLYLSLKLKKKHTHFSSSFTFIFVTLNFLPSIKMNPLFAIPFALSWSITNLLVSIHTLRFSPNNPQFKWSNWICKDFSFSIVPLFCCCYQKGKC